MICYDLYDLYDLFPLSLRRYFNPDLFRSGISVQIWICFLMLYDLAQCWRVGGDPWDPYNLRIPPFFFSLYLPTDRPMHVPTDCMPVIPCILYILCPTPPPPSPVSGLRSLRRPPPLTLPLPSSFSSTSAVRGFAESFGWVGFLVLVVCFLNRSQPTKNNLLSGKNAGQMPLSTNFVNVFVLGWVGLGFRSFVGLVIRKHLPVFQPNIVLVKSQNTLLPPSSTSVFFFFFQ